ncbi:MAG TPA: alkaline phosphatase family protein [Solirubrobacterales bacterium]|nr:alkaline phosphatase family protein [Solirubrobacterales bacterium]
MSTAQRKLMLVVVDSLHTEMLERTVAAGAAPTFKKLLDRGALVPDCVSSFPSVTPVACSEIATGAGPDRHWISGMNWYHRVERRYVEYGSSLEATRAFGLFRTLYDTVYNMNMAHLSHEVETVFERLDDAGVRTACTPFLIYRGRHRHELGLEGLLRRMAVAAKFHHAVWGPEELFYGELYASRKVPCRPTLARPGTRDEYSACVAEELVEHDLYDFLLLGLPDNDYYSHRFGPEASIESIAHADASLERVVDAAGGFGSFLADHAVILLADHSQVAVDQALPIVELLADEWRVLQPNSDRAGDAELAVSPTARAAQVYVLEHGRRFAHTHAALRARLRALDGIDLVAWVSTGDGTPAEREGVGAPLGEDLAVRVERAGGELAFRPGSEIEDRRGGRWSLDGDPGVLDAEIAGDRIESRSYPDALGRLWSAAIAPHAGDVVCSLAEGYECVDWGGASHIGGGSHGSLHAGDSLAPLLIVGFEPGIERRRRQWSLHDVAGLVLEHFGVATDVELAAA